MAKLNRHLVREACDGFNCNYHGMQVFEEMSVQKELVIEKGHTLKKSL